MNKEGTGQAAGEPVARLLSVAAVMLAAAALGFFLHQYQRDSHHVIDPDSSTINTRFPDFVLSDINNKPRFLSEWRGQPLVINFWATWCPPCLNEIPVLKALHADRAADGVQVIGIAVDRREAVAEYARREDIDYPLLTGEQAALEAAAAFGMQTLALPFTVFADASGRIITLALGELNASEAGGIIDAVLDVDRGRISLEQARARIKALRR
jgi:peroxiredoxin